MNYYRRYSGDYLRDTSRLSMLEHGAYSLMLDYYYSEETPLPLDRDEIYTMVRAMKPEHRDAVDKILDRYFDLRDDGYHNNRADEELAVATSVIETARENGKLGGRPKKPAGNPDINPHETSDETQPETGRLSKHGEKETQTEPANNHPPTTILQPPSSNHHPPKNKRANGMAQAPVFVLPDWVPQEHWNAWIEARKKKRNAPTDYAKKLAVMKLDNLREQGHEPAQVLMHAAFNGYTGLWPPKEPR